MPFRHFHIPLGVAVVGVAVVGVAVCVFSFDSNVDCENGKPHGNRRSWDGLHTTVSLASAVFSIFF